MKILKPEPAVDVKLSLRELLDIDAAAWSLGRLFSPPASGSIPLWGLMVVDGGGSLHFVNFRQDNWFSALFTQEGRAVKTEDAVKCHETWSRQDRIELLQIKKRGLFSRFLKRFPHYQMKMTSGETVIFELEEPNTEFLTALEG